MNSNFSVLIIEDDPFWASELQLMLTELGFKVVATITHVEDALTAIRTLRYDIALLDIFLNGKDIGLELGKLLNAVYKKPYVFVTDSSNKHSLMEAVACKPSAHLSKPVSKASLFVTIQTAIQNFNINLQASFANDGMQHFFVKQGNYFKRIEWHDVVLLTSQKNYTRAMVKSDNSGYLFRSSLQKTMNHIVANNVKKSFLQINRAEVLNISFIEKIQQNQIFTAFGTFIIGDAFADNIKKRLNLVA